MRPEWNKKYTTIAIYACLVIVFGVVCVAAAINIEAIWAGIGKLMRILNPIFYGFVIAFLVNPLYRIFERKVFIFIHRKKDQDVLRRVVSLIAAYLVIISAITGFVVIVVPQIVQSASDLESRMSGYVKSVQGIVNTTIAEANNKDGLFGWLFDYVDASKLGEGINGLISQASSFMLNSVPLLTAFIGGLLTTVKDALLGLVISVYFLYSRDKLCAQIKKVVYATFKKENADGIVDVTRITGHKFERFIDGKIIDSIIIGILTFIVLVIFAIPYPALIAVIVGVTNVIPFFGPFIGAIPSAFIIFISEPTKALWFIIIILVIQQLDGNVIGPAILGDSTGLSALWIIISLLVMSGLFGLAGWVIGVPLFAVLYTLFSEFTNKRLEKRELPVHTADYYRSPDEEPKDTRLEHKPGRMTMFIKKKMDEFKLKKK